MVKFSEKLPKNFPLLRMRRNRMRTFSRKIVAENNLNVDNLIQPLFVTEGKNENTFIESMPGIKRHSIDSIVNEAKEIESLGIPAIAIFPNINNKLKDAIGSEALNENNIICKTIKAIKKECPNLGLICDVALDPYTDHGHDGIIHNNEVDNDETIKILCEQAIVQAKAGCDIIAPSDMMDGRVKKIRTALDSHNFINTIILAYSSKYASAFYGPFRNAVGSKINQSKISKNSYQMDPSNSREAMREIELDINEGADIILIKPAISYLDIIKSAYENYNVPIFAYQVSGEYSMIKAAANNNWVNEKDTVYESLISIKRAGATSILTYFAKSVAKNLKEGLYN